MTSTPTALPLRNDTVLGVCEAIGQDFGFHANWLRIAFALTIFVSPAGAIGAYLALGAVVVASRLIFRDRIATEEVAAEQVTSEVEAAEEMRLAA